MCQLSIWSSATESRTSPRSSSFCFQEWTSWSLGRRRRSDKISLPYRWYGRAPPLRRFALADPPGLWVIIPFRSGTPYWTAIGQSTCRSVFGATCRINGTSVGNDDPNQPHTSLAACAKWLVIDRHARYIRCPRESLREQ